MKRGSLILLTLPLLLFAACGGSAAMGDGATNREANDPNLLTREQVERYTDAFQAVQTLKSQWLRVRTPPDLDSTPEVVVYENGVRIGPPEVLRQINGGLVENIRYYNGITASSRWGLGHENGVIFVTTRN